MHGFTISKQELRKVTNYSIVSDTVNYLEFEFTFSTDWDGLTKYAQFTHGDDTPKDVEIINGKITANSQVALSPGEWGIKVFGLLMDGITTEKRVTTNTVALFVLDSGLKNGETFPAVGGSIGEQILASEESRVTAEGLRVTAENARVQTMSTGHNAFNNIQGGTETERYHMTQAQNAALHAHSNKTALDAVSGTNTGDQNAAGIPNTPAGNIAATTVQAAINELDTEKEAVANKVTSMTGPSTDTQYPSAKSVYNSTMRLLISRTIGAGENVSAITWTQDDAGSLLALSEIEGSIFVPSNLLPAGYTAEIRARINDLSGVNDYTRGNSFLGYISPITFSMTQGRGLFHLKKNGNAFYGVYWYTRIDGVTILNSTGVHSVESTQPLINKLYFYLSGLTYFPTGTVIEIYGRTA